MHAPITTPTDTNHNTIAEQPPTTQTLIDSGRLFGRLPSIAYCELFTEQEAKAVDWNAVWRDW